MEKVTDKGVLKYRMPNILEIFDFLDTAGILDGKFSHMKAKRNIIEAMENLIDFSGIEGAKSYDDILSDVDNMLIPLSEISDDILTRSFEVFRKKSLSQTQLE